MVGRHGTCNLVFVTNKEEKACDLSAFFFFYSVQHPSPWIELPIFKVGLLTSVKHFLNSLTNMSDRMLPS